ncbi:MAG: hypothetical protein WBC44_16825 [Planctomycetaceae bacterium]
MSAACSAEPRASSADFPTAIADILSVDREGKNGQKAATAAKHLAAMSPEAILPILKAFPNANPLAANLLRSSIETIADRAEDAGMPLPTDELAAFAAAEQYDPRARRLAYELAVKSDPSVAKRLIPRMLADPGPEFRRDAVAHWIAEAERFRTAGQEDEAKAAWHKALSGAIYDDQVRTIVKALDGYGEKVDVRRHFGFINDWKLIGPFDNRGMKGFAASYPPEKSTDFDATYAGKQGDVAWKPISTDDPYGQLDLTKHLDDDKGTAVYLAAEFKSPHERPVEIRLGTPNAWKLWVNGDFLFGREEYHRGAELDQYRVPATLRAGTNMILLKMLQNEQTEDYAKHFAFRLRVCDATGVAVLATGPTATGE